MSQAGILDVEASHPQIATSFTTDSGTAVPLANNLELLGDSDQGLSSSASGKTITYTIADASDSQKGVQENATSAETLTGASSTLTVVPSGLEAKLGDQTLNGVVVGGGGGAALKSASALSNGQLWIGSEGSVPTANTLTAGSGISITSQDGSITITNSAGGFSWTEVTGTSQAMAVQNGYVANNAALVTLTLPATASIGESMQIVGKGAGLFRLAQNAGQTVHIVSSSTTTGAGGSLTAIEQYASMEIICITANTDFVIVDSIGNFTVV
jgi:hypothetical protein